MASDDLHDDPGGGALEVTASAGALTDAVTTAQRTVIANPPLVAYTGVLITASRGRLLVAGSDGETTVAARLAAPGCKPGKALVAPKPLVAWLSSHPRELQVTLRADGPDLTAEVPGRRPYRFRGLSAMFPDPHITRSGLAQADLSGLADAVSTVRHAADGTVRFRSSPAGLWIEATDDYRAAAALLRGVDVGDLLAVAPLAPVAEMGRQGIDAIGLDSRGRELRGASESAWVATRLSSTVFPEVDQLVEGVPSSSVVVGTRELRTALTRLGAVADGAPARITIGSSQMTIEASNGDVGDGAEVVTVDGNGGGFACAVAIRYLVEAVSAHPTEWVQLSWSGPERPLYLTSESPVGPRMAIVMPVKL